MPTNLKNDSIDAILILVIDMVHVLSKKVASVLILNEVIHSEDEDIYVYAGELIISAVINVLCCILISFIFAKVAEGVAFVSCFALLRRYTGGYHANHHWSCILTFSSIFTAALLITISTPEVFALTASIIISILSALTIWLFAPVEHENKPISSTMRTRLRTKSRITVIVMGLVVGLGAILTHHTVFYAIALSMASVMCSMTYAILSERRKSHERDESE